MNANEFREAGKQLIDYIADYLENIRDRPVLPNVEPFYIRDVVPKDPPKEGEKWPEIFNDIENVVMRGMTHWQSPYFYAYFPASVSYPGILGDMLSGALGCIGFTWYSSPACTELEMQMCDWMARALGLPEIFIFNSENKEKHGGGVIQGSMSECTFVTTLAAKRKMIEKIRQAILKTAELRTKEEQKNQEQFNQNKLKQGFIGIIKDVIKMADDLQENNKFLNKNILNKDQLKDETSRLINLFLNKKDKTQETVNNLNKNEQVKDIPILNGKNGLINNNPDDSIKNNKNDKEIKHNKENNINEANNLNNLNYNLVNEEEETILDLHLKYLILTDNNFTIESAKLVMYCSIQAHSSVEKAALLSSVIIRKIEPTSTDENDLGIDGLALEKAILKDLECGLVPFYVCATLGTTSSLEFDKLDEIGLIAKKYGIWLHVDAAYAGSAFILEEYRYLMNGVEMADSFAMNPHKWLLVNFDCSILWVKDSNDLDKAMNVSPHYLKHRREGQIPDYRHWQVSLGRRFRSLKIWFVLRSYGITGLQNHIRRHINLAIAFKNLLKTDHRFEITSPVTMGLICFRLIGTNELNERLVNLINERKNIHMMSTMINEKYIIRFAICSPRIELKDIEKAFNEILTSVDILEKEDYDKLFK